MTKTLARLHEVVYPETYWDPYGGPVKMRQVLHRLRQWLNKNYPDFLIQELNGNYYIRTTKRNYRMNRDIATKSPTESMMERLYQHFLYHTFSFTEFQIWLQYSEKSKASLRTQRRWFKKLLSSQKLIKIGNTRSSTYQIRQE